MFSRKHLNIIYVYYIYKKCLKSNPSKRNPLNLSQTTPRISANIIIDITDMSCANAVQP